MLEILLYTVIGSVAGVLTFFSCMIIWEIDFKKISSDPADQSTKDEDNAIPDESLYVPPEPALRSSISLQHQEIGLFGEQVKNKDIIIGSFVDVERKVDGAKTFQRVFLN